MDGSLGLTLFAVLVGWPIAALLLGLILGRAISACGSHDTAPGDPGLGFGPAAPFQRVPTPAQAVPAVRRDAV